MVATTFYLDVMGDALKEMESDELLFIVSTPFPTRHVLIIVNAADMLMRQATSTTILPLGLQITPTF